MPVATLKLAALLAAAGRVGVVVDPVAEGGNLHVWVTPQDEVLYVGRTASHQRIRTEKGWVQLDPRDRILPGIVTLLRVNRARPQALFHDPATYLPLWSRGHPRAVDAIRALRGQLGPDGPSLEQVEELLIRIAVRYGCPLGNAQHHSQWESPVGRPADTLAALAVEGDRTFRIPQPSS